MMFKRIFFPVLEFAAFLGLMYMGGDWDAINLGYEMRELQNHQPPHALFPTIKTQISSSHILIANGLLYAAVLFVLILLFQLLRKKMRPASLYTTAAFVVAVLIALALKMGLVPAQ